MNAMINSKIGEPEACTADKNSLYKGMGRLSKGKSCTPVFKNGYNHSATPSNGVSNNIEIWKLLNTLSSIV